MGRDNAQQKSASPSLDDLKEKIATLEVKISELTKGLAGALGYNTTYAQYGSGQQQTYDWKDLFSRYLRRIADECIETKINAVKAIAEEARNHLAAQLTEGKGSLESTLESYKETISVYQGLNSRMDTLDGHKQDTERRLGVLEDTARNIEAAQGNPSRDGAPGASPEEAAGC